MRDCRNMSLTYKNVMVCLKCGHTIRFSVRVFFPFATQFVSSEHKANLLLDTWGRNVNKIFQMWKKREQTVHKVWSHYTIFRPIFPFNRLSTKFLSSEPKNRIETWFSKSIGCPISIRLESYGENGKRNKK